MTSPSSNPSPENNTGSSNEPVWTYRGYELHAGEFNTAMIHFFRAEVARANVWRQRLDTTTNWAVVTTGAVISLTFTQNLASHLVILLNLLLLTIFLVTEARRYRYYELWSSRVRMMETDFFAAMLVPPVKPSVDWAESLAESLLHPQFPISELEALGRRLRRNYLWIYLVVGIAWVGRLALYPNLAHSFADIVTHAAVDNLPGEVVLIIVGIFYFLLFLLTFATIGMRSASGEVLSRYDILGLDDEKTFPTGKAWFRQSRRRQEVMTLIVTDDAKKVSDRIIAEMSRGATILTGEGAYTGSTHSVLMVAITVTEIAHLKAIVSDASPNSFVVTIPVKSVLGEGFMPLKEK